MELQYMVDGNLGAIFQWIGVSVSAMTGIFLIFWILAAFNEAHEKKLKRKKLKARKKKFFMEAV